MSKTAAYLFLSFIAFASYGDTARAVSASEFFGDRCDYCRVSVEATVTDVLQDETNPKCVFFVLDFDGKTIYAPMKTSSCNSAGHLAARFVGAHVRATGLCDPFVPEPRRQLGRQLYISSIEDIHVISPAPDDPFSVPEIGDTQLMTPPEIAKLGRRKISGTVLASWGGKESLLRTRDGVLARISFAEAPAPRRGQNIEAAGLPASDVYRVNLERAVWRKDANLPPFAAQSAVDATAKEIMTDGTGRLSVKPQFHGKNIRISGMARSIYESGGDTVVSLENGRFMVPVRFKKTDDSPEIEIGSRVEATGTCILDVDNWRPNAALPQIKGFFVVCDADGLRVISHPPWWTAGRLLVVIAFLLAAIGAVLVWNASLRRLAERRSRELLKSRVSELKSSLKVSERTRLAAELHDTLAQNLTGVSMEISAAQRLLPASAPSAAIQHLEFASNAIASSRDELRNCLWDLRGEALDQPDMEKAVEFSIRPHVGDTSVAIRFRVPRARLSDALAHATLRIVRELTINAIRHGGAKTIRIAGCIDGDLLKFSVSDDGRGFDPESAPSIDQGHFGLQGIRERVDTFGGSISIDSSPGRGTRVDVTVAIDGEEEDKPE